MPEDPARLAPVCLGLSARGWRCRLRTAPGVTSMRPVRTVTCAVEPRHQPRREPDAPVGTFAVARRPVRTIRSSSSQVSMHWLTPTAKPAVVAWAPPGTPGRTHTVIAPVLARFERTLDRQVRIVAPAASAALQPPAAARFTRIEQAGPAGQPPEPARGAAALPGRAGAAGPPGPPGTSAAPTVMRRSPVARPAPARAEPGPASEALREDAGPRPSAAPAPPPVPDLDDITTQVIRRIERRAIAQRERLARG